MELGSQLAILFQKLSQSKFRSSIKLSEKDYSYLKLKGKSVIAKHATEFISQRLAPAHPVNDGKQTPWKGHPVFVAQHATATCCRSCLLKWHNIPKGFELTSPQQQYIVRVIMLWLNQEKFEIRKSVSKNLSLL
ncbi:DUF4186 domain-containing protein [Entomomonas moraniae]|uniref:DUF4186 domain-containing protein n=1 Tax=Entomomonas moraniae TaxID=2213226 RepID=A0A3S9XDG7_9GAMM|nr:DUF4186 domain-containing protein [Entomomonas moraniae]AZS50348.1 DUF4186 domain-containing protein [Entomomonas moraniae]